MGRLQLTCSCGWVFFIAESSTAREVPCASCGAPVPTESGTVVTAGDEAVEQDAHHRLRWVYKALVVVLVVGVVGAVVISARTVPGQSRPMKPVPRDVEDLTGPRRPSQPPPDRAPIPPPPPFEAPRPEPPPPVPAPPPPAPVRLPAAEIALLRRSVPDKTALLNLGGIVSEVLRMRGLAEEHARVVALLVEWKMALDAAISRLAQHGERCIADGHFQPGDRIVEFARKDLSVMHPGDAANVMASWLAAFRPPTTSEQVAFLRGGRKISEYVSFAAETEGINRLLRTPGLSLTTIPAATLVQPISEGLLQKIHFRLGALPAAYRSILPETDRRRMELLLASRVGTLDDLVFLEVRILGDAVVQFEKDAVAIRLRAADLEKKVEETTAVDVLHFKDGRRLQGLLLEENDRGVRFRGRFGSVQFPKEEVLRVERGRGAGVEFPARFKAAGGNLEALVPLLAWCQERKLGVETEYVACLVLAQDPLHEGARLASGIRRPASRP